MIYSYTTKQDSMTNLLPFFTPSSNEVANHLSSHLFGSHIMMSPVLEKLIADLIAGHFCDHSTWEALSYLSVTLILHLTLALPLGLSWSSVSTRDFILSFGWARCSPQHSALKAPISDNSPGAWKVIKLRCQLILFTRSCSLQQSLSVQISRNHIVCILH